MALRDDEGKFSLVCSSLMKLWGKMWAILRRKPLLQRKRRKKITV